MVVEKNGRLIPASFLILLSAMAFLLACHLPFLKADPDYYLSESRDANTDEGLYTCQIRNYINHQSLCLDKTDGMIKTPLLSILLYFPFVFFGDQLEVGRLVILCLSAFLFLFVVIQKGFHIVFAILSFFIVFFEYHIFNYCHLCLAEMLSVHFILLGLMLFLNNPYHWSASKLSFITALIMSISYFIKLQFIYVLGLLPSIVILQFLLFSENRKYFGQLFLYVCLYSISILFFYFLVWYFPNQSLFDYVMKSQSENKFESWMQLSSRFKYNFRVKFHSNDFLMYAYAFYFIYIAGLVYFIKGKDNHFKTIFIGLSMWILIESHKLFMLYLPTRYMVSLFFPMLLLTTYVLSVFLSMKGTTPWIKQGRNLAIIISLVLIISNGIGYGKLLQRRSFSIHEINDYLSACSGTSSIVLGAWAPSLTWKSKSLSLPVWKNYFNDKDVFNQYHPNIIITEKNEEDSESAFLSRGIRLDSLADSIKYFRVNRWDLKIIHLNGK